MASELQLLIASDADVIAARQQGRDLAAQHAFSAGDQTVIAVAISEVARNIVRYAKRGQIVLQAFNSANRVGILIVARDQGPGIADLQLAMQDGYSTSGGLGLGLPGARRLMDEFDIQSQVGAGTTVTMRKWRS
ncbi:MAG: anti-sigma regulatory factor [Gemmatimonadales bacterium]